MNDQIHNSETPELHLDLYDSDSLPSLDDLMAELEANDEKAQVQQVAAVTFGNAAAAQTALAAEAEMANTKALLLEQENQELRQALEALQSNFDKYRWRAERDRSENYTFAVIAVVKELLPVLDNFGRALDNAERVLENDEERLDFSQFTTGVRLIQEQIFKVLGGMGVEMIQAVGQPFNPQYHEAVAAVPDSETPPNTVVEEVLRGYRIGDKLVRASMVKVSTQS